MKEIIATINSRLLLKKGLLYILLISSSATVFGQGLPKMVGESDFTIGKTIDIESEILGEVRTLNIYLPSSYSNDSSWSYPVIYLLDGSKDQDFIHVSGIVQFATFPWISMIPESIVVGIGNVDRKRDFTYPSKNELDRKEFPTAGKSQDFIRFLKNELKPFIESTFRISNQKTIIGQSLGGLLATEILFTTPDLFDNYIIVSPSLWWSNEDLLSREPVSYSSDKSIYIAVGREGELMERTAKNLYDVINIRRDRNTMLYFDFLEDRSHGDALHEAVYHALEKIF